MEANETYQVDPPSNGNEYDLIDWIKLEVDRYAPELKAGKRFKLVVDVAGNSRQVRFEAYCK